jgi:hypothetical protein
MIERRTIGQILVDFGKITESEMTRALEYQEKNGGYFGKALIALDMLTQEELEWTLASQFDLPYVFPEADSIDPDAAALVTPEWALSNLTLPIMKTADALTVIVGSPLRTIAVDDLERMCGLRIDLALASAGKIRELIRQVYSRIGASKERQASLVPADLTDFVASALESNASRFGVSLRGHRAIGWFENGAVVQRHLLTSTWEEELDRITAPRLSEQTAGKPLAAWSGQLQSKGASQRVEVSAISSQSAREILFVRTEVRTKLHDRFPQPPSTLLADVNLLVRSGAGRFAFTTSPSETAEEILPYLPLLLLDSTWRTVHIQSVDPAVDDLFVAVVPMNPTERQKSLNDLRAFRFDAVTAQLSGSLEEWVEGVLELGRVAFVAPQSDSDRIAAQKAGISWELQLERRDSGAMEWSLTPLRI